MASAPDLKHGKKFEKDVDDLFRDVYTRLPMTWERVVDSHTAGNLIRKADADFKLVMQSDNKGQPWLHHVECKCSVNFNSLADGGALKSLVKATQIAKMRISERAGVFVWYWFKSEKTGLIELWTGDQVHPHFSDNKTFKQMKAKVTTNLSGLAVIAANPWMLNKMYTSGVG